ncbi:EamA/RhaT family transporter [Citreimonas sp.]|uniref:EamA/RhaT family transporter n=1 Tax=Citreimonas sp. TaxID=3036715 RepID=UPI0040591B1D
MELWVLATLAAATIQTLRFVLHKQLAAGGLSATASTFARFAYAAPGAAVMLVVYIAVTGVAPPMPVLGFAGWVVLGGLGQILATILLVRLFARRNFATGVTLKKTEVVQTALLGLALLGDTIPLAGWAAIGLGLVGVLLLSEAPAGALRRFDAGAVALGLGSGFFFAVAGVGYRAATLAVPTDDALLRAGLTLTVVTALQTAAMALWLRLASPGDVTAVWRARRRAAWLGLASMAGSWCWFTAFTLQAAALVYAVGQVELILSLAASVLIFHETVTRRELAGCALVGVSVLILVLAT